METEGMRRYRERMEEWLDARERAGGELPAGEEAHHAARVEDVWRSLTEEEQDALARGC